MATLKLAFLSSAALELLASISVAIVAVSVGMRLTHGSMTLQAGLLAILLAPEAYWPVRRVGAEFHAAADGAEAIDGILAELAPLPPRRPRHARATSWAWCSTASTTRTPARGCPCSPGSRWMPAPA
jgi:ABC-type transport system involved in cytochrome bd biosynthesis fused ATPase/permease subunit